MYISQVESGLFLPLKIKKVDEHCSYLIQKIANAFQTIIAYRGKFYCDVFYPELGKNTHWNKQIVAEMIDMLDKRARLAIIEIKKAEPKTLVA